MPLDVEDTVLIPLNHAGPQFVRVRPPPKSIRAGSIQIGSPTPRSTSLLQFIPVSIFSEIFRLVLAEELFYRAARAPFYHFIKLSNLIAQTKVLRGVCRS